MASYTSDDFDSIAPRLDFLNRMQNDAQYICGIMQKVEQGLQPSPFGEGKEAKKKRQLYLYMLVKRMVQVYGDSTFHQVDQRPEAGVFELFFENIGQWGHCYYPTGWYREDRNDGLLNKLIALGEFSEEFVVILKSYPSGSKLNPSNYCFIPNANDSPLDGASTTNHLGEKSHDDSLD
jgi:hypothetical protein